MEIDRNIKMNNNEQCCAKNWLCTSKIQSYDLIIVVIVVVI